MGVLALAGLASKIVDVRGQTPDSRAVLVALTGIDGCGKGFVSRQLADVLCATEVHAIIVNIDGWLDLPQVRFSRVDPAAHFYANAIRFDALFSQLVRPLRDGRGIRLEADFAEETATPYRRHVYEFADVEVILLEGIYLLKRELVGDYDLSAWIDCSYETALERAIARAQEGLSPEDTVRAYRTIYFPAQELHARRDEPRMAATVVLNNDPRVS